MDTLDIDQLYEASYRRLVVQMYACCGDLADAEDAVQEAFVTQLRKRGDLTRAANPEGWLRTVAGGDDLIVCGLDARACEVMNSGPSSLVLPEVG